MMVVPDYPFLPPDFDPKDMDLVQICMDRVNPMVHRLDEYILMLEKEHNIQHTMGMEDSAWHTQTCLKFGYAEELRTQVSMSIWN
jgi:hypothetical protein